jgi:hypothetical protein
MNMQPKLWLDAHALGVRVLRNGDDPWQNPGEFGLFQRELVGWLSLETVDLGLGPLLEHWRARSGASLRDGGDIEELLDQQALWSTIVEAMDAVEGAMPGRPVMLRLPGPRALTQAWLADDADDDAIDDTAMALAGLARGVFRSGLSAIAIDEPDAGGVSALQPLINLARHYETALVLMLDADTAIAGDSFARVYRPVPGEGEGAIVPVRFWRDADVAPPTAQARFARVPADLHPDEVLAGVARLC